MRRGRIPELGLFLLGYQVLQNIGVTNIPPVTLVTVIVQVAIYLGVVNVPRLCISGASVARDRDWVRLVVPALRHTHDIHLYYNMVSLAWKGIELERRLGPVRFLITLVILTVTSSGLYVILAMVGAQVLEDPSLMSECAIGFSGVLFAMKVLNIHFSRAEETPTSFFGFLVPMKHSVWLELIIIQVMVPNSSFMGHLAGILTGMLYVESPLSSMMSSQQYQHQQPRRQNSSSPSLIRTLLPSNLVTLMLCGAQICLAVGKVPNLKPFIGCLPNYQVDSINLLRWKTVQLILLSPFYHQSFAHLLINLISFYMKGRKLENKLGHMKFLRLSLTSVLCTCLSHVLLTAVTRHVYPDLTLGTCIVGLSASLYCLKVVCLYHTRTLDWTLMFEMAELVMLLERNTRLYHVSGLLAGVVLVTWARDLCSDHTWPGSGHQLGTGAGQPAWTRSWGYAGPRHDPATEHAQYEEALRRSRQTHEEEERRRSRTYTVSPSAPPAEDEDLDLVPDLVRERPPLYAQGPAPPPPGQAYRMGSGSVTSDPEDEVRRRHGHRFS